MNRTEPPAPGDPAPSFQAGRDDALEFVERHGLRYPAVRDEDGRIFDAYGPTGQPETFFIDENGVILEHVRGPLFRETLFQLLDPMVAGSG